MSDPTVGIRSGHGPAAGPAGEIASLIERSSFGAPGARLLRERASTRISEEIRARASLAAVSVPREQAVERPVPSDRGCPYVGLRAFKEEDQGLFFGREGAVREVLRRLSARVDDGFLVVSGAPGAGKSSLLRAGVLPALAREGLPGIPDATAWPRLVFAPGPAPVSELADRVAALADLSGAETRRELTADPACFGLLARSAVLAHGQRHGSLAGRRCLVLVIDGFDEIFTQCPDENERRSFITALHSATFDASSFAGPAALVILGVRADFEARCAEYQELAAAIQDRYLLTAMSERELHLAIEQPARRGGVQVEPELTALLLRDVSARQPLASSPGTGIAVRSDAGVLPQLSYALAEAWRVRASPHALTVADYERTGGVGAAVAIAAQRAYDSLTGAQREAARKVFLALTGTTSAGTTFTRRATWDELAAGEDAEDLRPVLEAFSAERLLTVTKDGAELSHQAILSAWPLLRDNWLGQTRADRALLAKLRDAVADWDAHQRASSYLWSGALLESAVAAVGRADAAPGRFPPVTLGERSFLAASRRLTRRARRLRQVAGILVCFFFSAVIATTIALHTTERYAVAQRDTATSRQLASESLALKSSDASLSRMMALAADQVDPASAPARYAMRVNATPPASVLLASESAAVDSYAFTLKGDLLALNDNGQLQVTVPLTGATDSYLIQLDPAGDSVHVFWDGSVFSPDGTLVATSTASGAVDVFSASDGRMLASLPPCLTGGSVSDAIAFSPDGKTLAVSASSPGRPACAQLWNVAGHTRDGRPLLATWGTEGISSLTFSPDEKTLAIGTMTGTHLLDVPSRSLGATLATDGASSVSFSRDGATLAVGTGTGVQLWDTASGRRIASLPAASEVSSMAFSPDGTLLVASSTKGWNLWDVGTLQPVMSVTSASPCRTAPVAFSRDGALLAVPAGSGKQTQLMDVGYLRPAQTHSYLCKQAGTTLSPGQWDRYVPGVPYQDVCPAFRPARAGPTLTP